MRTMPPRSQNDTRILDAAAEIISRGGIGSASLNAVAKHAGLSHTAMTQRYSGADELLSSLWEHRVVPEYLAPLVELARSIAETSAFDVATIEASIASLVSFRPEILLATEILCAFPSNQTLGPVVRETFQEMSAFSSMNDRAKLVQCAYVMELLMGATIVRRSLAVDEELLSSRLLTMLTDARTAHPEEPIPMTDASHLNIYPFDTGSEKLDRVLASCLWHVAEVGFDGMSTKQIAKTAGVSEGYLFSVFKTKAEIFIRATELQEQMGLEANRVYAQGTGARFAEYLSNAIFLRDWQKPELNRQRAIMLEQRRVSWHNNEMRENSSQALAALVNQLSGERDVLSETGRVTLLLNLALPIGAAVMAEMYPAISGYSHTVVTPGLNLEG